MKKDKKTIIWTIISIVAGVIVSIIPPPESLTVLSMRGLGIIVWTLISLMTNIFPNYVTAILMCILFVVTGCADFKSAFAAFSDTTFWLIIGVLGIGIAVNKSGLLNRLSLYALRLFPGNFNGVVAALLGVGTICQPIMPSTSAKQSIMAPVALALGETLGFQKKSKQMAGLFNATYIGWSITGTVFISASFLGYLYFGYLPVETQAHFTWMNWFIAMIPWAVVVVVGNYLAITRIYKPEVKQTVSKEVINERIKALGPMSKQEKQVSIIMILTIGLWIGENTFGISACITSLLSLMIMAIIGLFNGEDFNVKMGWGFIMFMGGIMCMSGPLGTLGITNWLGSMIEPAVGGLVNNPYIFVTVLTLLLYGLRFVLPDMITPVILVTMVLGPVAQNAGINPWIPMMVAYCGVCVWPHKYSNFNMLVGYAAFGGDDSLDYKDVTPGALAHMAVSLVGLLVSIPYWSILEYIN